MNTVINWCPFIFILLVLVSVCDSDVWSGNKYPFVSDEICGNAQFGLTHGGGKSLAVDCGKGNLADRSLLADVCIANLYRPINLPSIIDDTNNIGYHTVFLAAYRTLNGERDLRSFRFNAEYELPGSDESYSLRIVQSVFDEICDPTICLTDARLWVPVHVDPHFFTDLKLHISDDQEVNACPDPIDCSKNVCIHFALNDEESCNPNNRYLPLDIVAYFGVRVKPYGISDVYKTVAVHARNKGSYGVSSSKKDHFYYIEYKHLQPLLEAAKCSTYCTDNDTGKTYCEVGNSCGAGTTSTTYSSGSYPPELIGDYAYVPYDNSLNICKLLYETDGDAYASTNIIFDERMGGRPHCDCVYGYGWNVTIQICEACERGLSLIGCPGPCHNKCEWNEYCTIEKNGIEKCVCKEGHALLSKDGQCKERLDCDNGTVMMSNGEWICQCDDGYYKLRKDGPCLVDSSVICFHDFPDCIENYKTDTTCVCRNSSVIETGMCSSAGCSCGTSEECSVDGYGGLNCRCLEDYTRIYSSDSCFHTLSCARPNETLRVTNDMDLVCNCKEGYIRSDEGDEIVCLDDSNIRFSCFFCVLWVIVAIGIN